jgi:hypothetical protein
VSSALGLAGAAVTIVGENAGADALAHACRSLELGRTRHAVCAAFDFPSPFACSALRNRGITVSPSSGSAAVLVLTRDEAREQKGVRLTAGGASGGGPEQTGSDPVDAGVSPAVAPLLRIARAVLHNGSDGRDLVSSLECRSG